MICIVGFSLLLFHKGMLCEKVTQSSPDKIVKSGSEVTLPCTYNSEYSDPDLYWYRLRPDHSFQFILYRDGTRALDEDFTQGRFSVQHSQTHKTFDLVISSLRTEDRATYYCGISSYVWPPLSDKLTFGKGTHLIVEAKSQPPTKPSVFVMRNGTNVACLVKDFYPKNVTINLQSSKKITEYDPAIVISPSGKYNAVKLGQYGDSNSVKCSVQHNNEIVYSTETEQTTNSPGDLKPMEPEIIQQTSESCHEPKVLARKVNMTSLTLLGLRLLFVKTVAVNFLLTATLFFC